MQPFNGSGNQGFQQGANAPGNFSGPGNQGFQQGASAPGNFSGPGNQGFQQGGSVPGHSSGTPGFSTPVQHPAGGPMTQGGQATGMGAVTTSAAPGAGAPISQMSMGGPQFTSSQEQVFYLSEKVLSFSSDDFVIKDAAGHTTFRVDASLLSMKGSRSLTDAAKHILLTIQHKQCINALERHGNLASFIGCVSHALIGTSTWEIYQGNGSTNHKLATVKKPHGLGKHASTQSPQTPMVNIHFGSAAAGSTVQPDMWVVGDVMGKGYSIVQGSNLVAEVSRALATKRKFSFSGKDVYAVRVLPGWDAAFVLALAVVTDELYHD